VDKHEGLILSQHYIILKRNIGGATKVGGGNGFFWFLCFLFFVLFFGVLGRIGSRDRGTVWVHRGKYRVKPSLQGKAVIKRREAISKG